MRRTRGLACSLFTVIFVAIAVLDSQFVRSTVAKTESEQLPAINITITSANQTEIILNETGVAQLPSYSGVGGYINQLGLLKGFGNYTGVSLSTLCGLVGGVTNTSMVKVVAADDYSQIFTYEQVNGAFTSFDPNTGENVSHMEPLVPMLSYWINGSALSSSEGPLRMTIVGPEKLATNSSYWVKQVIRVEIMDTTIPETPAIPIIYVLLVMTLAVLMKKRTNLVTQKGAKS